MSKRKYFKTITLLIIITFLFTACSTVPNSNNKDGKINIVTTIFPQYDFAKQVGGDKVNVRMLVTPGGESHSYEPTPQDISAVQGCNIFICSGGESDVWSKVILKSLDVSNIKIINMMDCVDAVEEEISQGMTEKLPILADNDDEEIEYDEHVWTSPKNAKKISLAIQKALIEVDGQNSNYYKDNYQQYAEKLDNLDSQYKKAVSMAKNPLLVFGDRFPFRYLFDEYKIKYYAAFPGCSTDTDVSASNMAFLIKKVKENRLTAVYYIEFSARKIADTISAETGAEPLLFHSCHTVSREDFENGVTYIDLMEKNLENLKRGLNIEAD